MLTYCHMYNIDVEDEYLGVRRILDVEPTVGCIVKQYCTEGYVPWEIMKIVPNGTSFGDNPCIKAWVKIHPYVKTHCNHQWEISPVLLLSNPPQHTRKCNKCNEEQIFNYGTANWTKR